MKATWSLCALCAFLLNPLLANASTLISSDFQRTGPFEQVIAPFTDNNGVQTVNQYSGNVEVVVSGVGNSLNTITNDAFYGVDGGYDSCVMTGVPIQLSCSTNLPTYQLGIASENAPFIYSGASDAQNFISFIDNVGNVTPGTVPDYDAETHTYHFVIDLSLLNISSSSFLTFGVTDDYYPDNGGEFLVDIYQVQAVPIPQTIGLLGSGLLGLIGIARRKRPTCHLC